VIRLERASGRDFWDFACRWEDREGHIAGNYVPRFFFDDEPQTPFTLCLLHRPSAILSGTTKCRYLDETPPEAGAPLGHGRCSVYADRPAACRVFPLSFQKSSQLAVLDDVPAHGRPEDGHGAYQLCPRPWQLAEIDSLEAPQQLAVAEYEAHFFRLVAAVWNQSPGPWLKFPQFLRLVYSRRVIDDQESRAAEPMPDVIPLPSLIDHRRAA
jgi:Fe-S-cluster containining protein